MSVGRRSPSPAPTFLGTRVQVLGALLIGSLLVSASGTPGSLANTSTTTSRSAASVCTPVFGPGIAPPASVPAGIPGFHAAWYGQSGYQSLCPGQMASAVVAYYNSGSSGWVSGRMGEVAYLARGIPNRGRIAPARSGATARMVPHRPDGRDITGSRYNQRTTSVQVRSRGSSSRSAPRLRQAPTASH